MNFFHQKILPFSIISLIISIVIVPVLPFASASIGASSTCQSGNVLIHRLSVNDYECVSTSTANTWINSGYATMVDQGKINPGIVGGGMVNANTMNKPNIIVIMGDDVGWFNIGAYNQGIMTGKTPNIDKIAQEGMRFTDYYADPSCTAGRASFITGELPIRTGLTTIGQAGATVGMPAQAPTIATVLKSMGYSTGQFGKNHLGDRNEHLPTVHGFDEFFGYLYHLDAMEDPFNPTYPPDQNLIVGPRNMIHSFASNVDNNTVDPRWGKVGMQIIQDAGSLPPQRMETLDNEILDHTINFMDKSQKENKPFFVWYNPSRMHVITHLSETYQKTITPENGYSIYEAGMTELDDEVGKLLKYVKDKGLKDNTIIVFTTDNGAEVFTWPDGGMTPFAGVKGTVLEGGMRVPTLVEWPGHIPPGKIENQMMSGLDWFPTLIAAAGDPDITTELLTGQSLGGTTYKVHLDGYNQMDMLTGNGPTKRNVVYYFSESTLGAIRIGDYKVRFIDQPNGFLGGTVTLNWPALTNLRLDPFERAGLPSVGTGSINYYNWYAYEFWRYVPVQNQVAELAKTFVDFPPMQKGASFNLDAIKKQIQDAQKLGD
ncbi:MAG TPA: arylsulfatase [Nitrosopumilaceae archaeon]|nr:arylsulfatase [Nitrosopumilaceae archaeon]